MLGEEIHACLAVVLLSLKLGESLLPKRGTGLEHFVLVNMAVKDRFTKVPHVGNILSHLHVFQVTPLLLLNLQQLSKLSYLGRNEITKRRKIYISIIMETPQNHSWRNACTGISSTEKLFSYIRLTFHHL